MGTINAPAGDSAGEPRLRDFAAPDQPAVRALVLAGLAEHWGAVDETLNPDLDDIATAYANGRTIVVEVDGVIVGSGTVRSHGEEAAEILRMSVAQDARRHGLGRLMVEALVATAKQWGASRVVLETSAHWHDVTAFYLSCGFRITHQEDGDFGRDTWFERLL